MLRPLKILMTADTVGGVFTYACELARALGGHGCEVALATMGGRPSEVQRGVLRSMSHVTSYESSFKLEWMEEPWEDVAAAGEWLLKLRDDVGPDVIHLNNYAHGALEWRAPVLVVGHSCVWSWFEAVHGCRPPQAWDRYHGVVVAGLRGATAVAAPSQAMLDALSRHYGTLPPSLVIPNGRNGHHFGAARRRKAPAAAGPFVLAAGRLWDEAKGIDRLARVASELPWPVRIAGSAEHPDGGTASFRNVELLGRLSTAALAAEMARADIYALPARYEPFGLSALEAGLSGCALVLGDVPSLREVWGEAACYVSSEQELLGTLRMLIHDEQLRGEAAERALHRARTFTPERMASSYVDLYGRLLRQRRYPRSRVLHSSRRPPARAV